MIPLSYGNAAQVFPAPGPLPDTPLRESQPRLPLEKWHTDLDLGRPLEVMTDMANRRVARELSAAPAGIPQMALGIDDGTVRRAQRIAVIATAWPLPKIMPVALQASFGYRGVHDAIS